MKNDWVFSAFICMMIIMAGVVLWHLTGEWAACNELGGHYVKGVIFYECVGVK